MNNCFKLLIVLLALITISEASHFRFGTISWQPTTKYNIIQFKADFAFRRTYFSYPYAVVGSTITEGSLNFGDKTSTNVAMTVTSYDPVLDWFTGSFTFTKTYSKDGDYTVIYTSCCRISSLKNEANGNWNITTSVSVKPTVSNTSPVSGMLPIVPVVYGRSNGFQVVASDAETLTKDLKFELTDVYKMTQPPGLSVNSTGYVTFTPALVGLYCTQIKITDGHGAYIVTDFIMSSTKQPGICSGSCSNGGSSCEGNSDCKNCGTIPGGGDSCGEKNPPYFTAPTPVDGAVINMDVNKTSVVNIRAESEYSTKSVVITTANVPSGMTGLGSQTGKNPGLMTGTWTPTASQVGRYVVSLGLVDSDGMSMKGGSQSFVIVVAKPECGHGSMVDGKCVCDQGWNSTFNCFDCDNGYHGPECEESEKCINGVSNGGIGGDGSCSCYFGYTGAACDIAVSTTCKPNDPSSVTDTTFTSGYLYPSALSAYISTSTSASALTLPMSVNVPYPIPKLDAYILLDVNPSTAAIASDIKAYAQSFLTRLTEICENVNFGLGFFSDAPTGYTFQSKLVIGSPILDDIKLFDSSNPISSSSGNSLAALKAAASTAVGWNNGAYRLLVVITDSDFVASTSTLAAETKNALISNFITPVVINIQNPGANWASFISNNKFGAQTTTGSGTDWVAKGRDAVKSGMYKIAAFTETDSDGFVASVPTPATISSTASSTTPVAVTLKYPTAGAKNKYPTASLSVVGFGKTAVTINYNHAPVATGATFTTNEDVSFNFGLIASDLDANIMNAKFITVPTSSIGAIQTSGGVPVAAGDKYLVTSTFKFVPAPNQFGSTSFTFNVNDGCVDSNTVTVTINVLSVNDPPVCGTISAINTDINTPASFTLTGTDVETAAASLKISLNSLAGINTYGNLKSGGTVLSTGDSRTGPIAVVYTQTNNVAASASFSYRVTDSDGAYIDCTVPMTLKHVNTAPTLTAQSPVTTNPLNTTTISYTVADKDSSTVTLQVVSVSATKGTFHDCVATTTPITSTWTKSLNTASGSAAGQICYFASDNTATGPLATITLRVTDGSLTSSNVVVNVNVVGQRANDPPTVNQITLPNMNQDTVSGSFVIDGVDTDSVDIGNLQALITQYPTKGSLLISSTSASAPAQSGAPYSLVYKPNAGYFGTDSFSYTVSDTLGATAVAKTTTVTVVHVNHKPTLFIPSYTFNQFSAVATQALSVNDPDSIDIVTCYITKVPTKATLRQFDGSEITSASVANPVKITDAQYRYTIIDKSGALARYTDSFDGYCIDNWAAAPLSSGSVTGSIVYAYVNQAPVALYTNVSTEQATPKVFTFKATDIEDDAQGVALTVKLASLPVNGKLTNNGVPVTDLALTYPISLTYTPSGKLSNWDTPGHMGPLDSISFVSIDSQGLQSNQPAVVDFHVEPRNPPVFDGSDTVSTLEDNPLPISIAGKPGNGGSSYAITVTGMEGQGVLSATFCMAAGEGCMDRPLTYPYTTSGAELYNFKYTPPANVNGDKLATISFILFENDLVSQTYTIFVNVIPVNDPPVIQLISYKVVGTDKEVPLTNTVSMPMDTTVILSYTGYDIDNDNNTLVSLVSTLPRYGSLYRFDESAEGFLGTEFKSSPDNVHNTFTNSWKVVFVPEKGRSGAGYDRMAFILKDAGEATSIPAPVTIDLDPINAPPVIIAPTTTFSIGVDTNLFISDVSYDDPDSTNLNNNLLTISILNADGESDENSVLNIAAASAITQSCNFTTSTATCVANKIKLNSIIKSLNTSHSEAGTYTLRIVVDDLGFNGPAKNRDAYRLTATQDLTITVNPPPVKKTSNKTVLSAAIAGAAAGAAIIAAALWKLLRKAAPPTDAFFGDNPFADGAVASNPLYVDSGNSGVNPFYEAQNN